MFRGLIARLDRSPCRGLNRVVGVGKLKLLSVLLSCCLGQACAGSGGSAEEPSGDAGTSGDNGLQSGLEEETEGTTAGSGETGSGGEGSSEDGAGGAGAEASGVDTEPEPVGSGGEASEDNPSADGGGITQVGDGGTEGNVPSGPVGVSGPHPEDHLFGAGSRHVIPQRESELVALYHGDLRLQADGMMLEPWRVDLVDGPTFAREYAVIFQQEYLIAEECQGIFSGRFEVGEIQVEEDLDAQGAQLSIEASAEGYRLTHTGPGRHLVSVTGEFVVELDDELLQEACLPLLGGEDGDRVGVSFAVEIVIQEAAAHAVRFENCAADGAVVTSGRPLEGVRVGFLNAEGVGFSPRNAGNPEVILETESSSTLENAELGIGGGIWLSGTRQKARLSTAFGTLAVYDLIELGDIDGWELGFRYATRDDVKAGHYPLLHGATYPEPETFGFISANAVLTFNEVPVCSPIFPEEFVYQATESSACQPAQGNNYNNQDFPGYILRLEDTVGSCEFDFSFPAANQGEGLADTLLAQFGGAASLGTLRTPPTAEETAEACANPEVLSIRSDFDVVWLAHWECERVEGDLEISASELTDPTLLAVVSEVTGDVVIRDLEQVEAWGGFENLTQVGGTVIIQMHEQSGLTVMDFPSLVEVGALDVGMVASLETFRAPLLERAAEVGFWSNDALRSIEMESLTQVDTLHILSNDALEQISFPALTDAGLEILHNNALPQCQVVALEAQGPTCLMCFSNGDDPGVCD